MPTDYYPEPDDQQDALKTSEEESGEEETESTTTALLPKSLLGSQPLEVGEELTVRVTHIYEDEVAVEPVTTTKEKTPPAPEALAGDEEFDAMEKGPTNA